MAFPISMLCLITSVQPRSVSDSIKAALCLFNNFKLYFFLPRYGLVHLSLAPLKNVKVACLLHEASEEWPWCLGTDCIT